VPQLEQPKLLLAPAGVLLPPKSPPVPSEVPKIVQPKSPQVPPELLQQSPLIPISSSAPTDFYGSSTAAAAGGDFACGYFITLYSISSEHIIIYCFSIHHLLGITHRDASFIVMVAFGALTIKDVSRTQLLGAVQLYAAVDSRKELSGCDKTN